MKLSKATFAFIIAFLFYNGCAPNKPPKPGMIIEEEEMSVQMEIIGEEEIEEASKRRKNF